MKILLTGATGFIGSHLLSKLVEQSGENTVLALCRNIPITTLPQVNWIEVDLSETNWTSKLPNEKFDIIIHLAQSNNYRKFPSHTNDIFNVNVKSTLELADWGVRHSVSNFLFTSTGNVYNFTNYIHYEEDQCEPETMYGASKLSAEILLKPFSPFMNILVVRLFGVYGPKQTNSMLSGIIHRFMIDEEIVLASNVGVRTNPIYIEDCVELLNQLIIENKIAGLRIINIGGSEIIDLKKVVSFLEAWTGKTALTRITSDDPKQLVGSIDRLRKSLPFKEKVFFEEGLRRTFNFLKLHS
jgi:nucleoside-diphosphate-sugar epimerase